MLDWPEFGSPDHDISVFVLRIGYSISNFDPEFSSYFFGKSDSEIGLYSAIA